MMLQSQFHAYYAARMLAYAKDEDALVSVFASSGIQAYPFQISAASFALRFPYQKGVILCDEAGMGKSLRKAEAERDAMTVDRLKILSMNRQINQLRQAFMKKQES